MDRASTRPGPAGRLPAVAPVVDFRTSLGPLQLGSPLVAASGTVGAVVDQVGMIPFEHYGAAVAKSVSAEPWSGNPPPRLAPAGVGMLNAVGVQNPGIDAWLDTYGPRVALAPVPVWGSAIGTTVEEFVQVAKGFHTVDVQAVELNLSCPNVDGTGLFALHPRAAAEVVEAVRQAVDLPVGVKLSPNAQDIVGVAAAVATAGADWVVLTNTVWGAGVDIETRRPALAAGIGGLSGPPLKPISLRCVLEVGRALPGVPIIGCGGVRTASDVVEYLLSGASAVGIGTAHFEHPKIGAAIMKDLTRFCGKRGISRLAELIGAVRW